MRPCQECRAENEIDAPRCLRCGAEFPPEPPVLPSLLVRWPGGKIEAYLLWKGVTALGRADDNDIVLNFPTLSAHHMTLEKGSGGVRLIDLASTNGTHLIGSLIEPHVPCSWQPGDVVRVGDFSGNSLSFTLSGAPGEESNLRQIGFHRLAETASILIGRGSDNQLVLDHPTISRQHAHILCRDGIYEIEDLGSTNGTFVNGLKIPDKVRLKIGVSDPCRCTT